MLKHKYLPQDHELQMPLTEPVEGLLSGTYDVTIDKEGDVIILGTRGNVCLHGCIFPGSFKRPDGECTMRGSVPMWQAEYLNPGPKKPRKKRPSEVRKAKPKLKAVRKKDKKR